MDYTAQTISKIESMNQKAVAAAELDAFKHILGNFDFKRVHEVMTFLGWSWVHTDGIPSMGAIIATVQEMFDDLQADYDIKSIYCGGLKLSRGTDDGQPLLRLEFIVEEWYKGII